MRPVLRINAEVQDGTYGYVELNTAVEKDNAGCYFLSQGEVLRKPESITANKEFCDCSFAWKFAVDNAHGKSIGKTLPAHPTEVKNIYPRERFSAENAAKIPCIQVLGTYMVCFER